MRTRRISTLTYGVVLTGALVAGSLGGSSARAQTPASAPAGGSKAAAPAALPAAPAMSQPVAIAPGGKVEYNSGLQAIQAYSVHPQGEGPWPAVILVHDIFGLTPWARHQADALAKQGFLVLVPNLYTRTGVPEGAADAGQARTCYEQMPDNQAVDDLRAAVDYLSRLPQVGEKPIGVVGYDMGGIYAMMLAAKDLRVKAAVNFYGRILYAETTSARPVSPVEFMFNLHAPMLSFYGDMDPQVPPAQIALLEQRLRNNPNRAYFDIVRYPGVGHSFLLSNREGYNAAAAQDATNRSREFLRRVLFAPPVNVAED